VPERSQSHAIFGTGQRRIARLLRELVRLVSPDQLQRLRDAVAFQAEHSHVDAALRQLFGEIILEVENEELLETAQRLLERSRQRSWRSSLEAQTAI
jgi:hypothetical protein